MNDQLRGDGAADVSLNRGRSLRAVISSGRPRDNDDELMRVLHDQHARALWTYVAGFTGGDSAQAQEIVQETLIRAWRTPKVLDQSTGSARAWLFTVARRIIIDEWRLSRRRPELLTDEPPELTQHDEADHVLDRRLVVAALTRLSNDHRDVLLETYIRGSSVAEAALKLGIPAGTIKSRTHYALHAFKLAIEEMGGRPVFGLRIVLNVSVTEVRCDGALRFTAERRLVVVNDNCFVVLGRWHFAPVVRQRAGPF